MEIIVNILLLIDIVAGLVGRTTDMRMEEVAAVVDDRVADVKVEEDMVVMEAMVEAAEEDGEDHQVGHLNPIISHLCVETSIMAPVDGTQHLRQLQGWQRRLVGKLRKALCSCLKRFLTGLV